MPRSLCRSAELAAAAVLLMLPLAGSAAANTPAPAPGSTAGASTTADDGLNLFYQRAADRGVTHKSLVGGVWRTYDLGGYITSGVGALTVGSEIASTWVYAAGGNGLVYSRRYSEATGTWGPWTSLGLATLSTPTASCLGDFTSLPIIWVAGTDRALWRQYSANGVWVSLGGILRSAPAAAPAIAGVCPTGIEAVVALGNDRAVWERLDSGWHRIGGRSDWAPAILRLPNGQSHVFALGTDRALWTATRSTDGAWSAFSRIGGVWRSAPAAQVHPGSPATISLVAQGDNGRLYRAVRTLGGSAPWTFAQVP
jgi:hypothetical protein